MVVLLDGAVTISKSTIILKRLCIHKIYIVSDILIVLIFPISFFSSQG